MSPARTDDSSDSDSEASKLRDPSVILPSDTHAERNPNLPHQEVRVLTKNTLSEAQKATRALRIISDQEKNVLMTADLKMLLASQNKELEDLAKTHAVKVEYLQKLTL